MEIRLRSGCPVETRVGLSSRYDNIRVGLQDTYRNDALHDTLTNDEVVEAMSASGPTPP